MDDPEEGYYAYNDFKKGLTMMKVVDDDSYVCYLNPLSRSALTPEAMESYMEHHPGGDGLMSHDRDADLPKYIPAEEPISDRRFLSQHFREACEGFPMRWLIPAPEQKEERQNEDTKVDSSDVIERQKRDEEKPCCCCLICFWCLG
ncbi:unnamed protein product [Owenia fusiformis]|uniref:Uncharacterized protein n=1 Tax=Owenia fusiformis TaxID=6347 RepID=A0A8J1YAQ5_OWEFU|nr:unnamed protein product [Owenia fusiformis]